MGAPTKAALLKLWMSGQNGQQPDQSQILYGTPTVIASLPGGSSEVIEALPPGASLPKSMKEEQAKLLRAYARLKLTKNELTGDEESKKKV